MEANLTQTHGVLESRTTLHCAACGADLPVSVGQRLMERGVYMWKGATGNFVGVRVGLAKDRPLVDVIHHCCQGDCIHNGMHKPV
jgi:hypothetical protein